ncbi:unnamed protein product [Oncorhynchus mykiss]|uniref:Uncharacterized protein n=1 Tax=Oncorhynchus mykiss TaxID=8022 RepID=A0A060Z778_ONCMY|nr:unnamed protein product [Oncorhynchus mykiss]
MSEADAPSAFTRGSRSRASLPVVRSTNQTRDRSLGRRPQHDHTVIMRLLTTHRPRTASFFLKTHIQTLTYTHKHTSPPPPPTHSSSPFASPACS